MDKYGDDLPNYFITRLFVKNRIHIQLFITLLYGASKPDRGNIENFMLHPYNKAIVQAVVHELPEMDVKEVSYEQLKEFTSERMTGGFGSTNK